MIRLLPILLLAVSGVAFAQDAGPNLITNGDFERWTQETGPPSGWAMVVGQSPTVLSWDGTAPHGGQAALRVQLGGENNTGWVAQQVPGVHPDTDYRLRGWVRVAADNKLPLTFVMEPNLGGCTLPAAQEWTAWEWTFNSREATELLPQFRLRGQGTVWFDDLVLEQVSPTGSRVMPDRVALLKLLAYQAHPVDPATNTDAWAAPFRGNRSADTAFPKASPGRGAPPVWKTGQWARYLCHDSLLVPSSRPEKRPFVALVDCAVLGSERVGGKPYYWLQSVVRLQRYWVAKSRGPYDSGEKILLERPRRAVLTALVDGPAWTDVRRYQLQVDEEPLLEYVSGRQAAWPWLDISQACIRPFADVAGARWEGRYQMRVPVTGMVRGRVSLPHLDRRLELVNWGETGARDERVGKTSLVNLPGQPYIGVAFDGFGTPAQVKEIVAAGAGLIEQLPTLYLGADRSLYNTLPAYIFAGRAWDVDLFDPCRGNFAGFAAHLDEPYQRQRKPNEYVKRGQATTLPGIADRYTEALRALLAAGRFWPGHQIHAYDSPASAAWYDLRAGADGFVLENARLVDELATLARVTSLPNARQFSDDLNIAFMAGATRQFGGWWGQGIYRWVPEQHWRDELVYYATRGARFVGFWLEKTPPPAPELQFYEQVLKALPSLKAAIDAAPRRPRQATAVLVIPYGEMIGLSGSAPERPWGLLDHPAGTVLTERLLKEAARLHQAGTIFDVVVNDPAYPPRLADYQQVIHLP